jgi:hypothetical protein
MIEVEYLFPKVEIFENRRPAATDLERILIVGHGDALLRRQDRNVAVGLLVYFTASPDGDRGVCVSRTLPTALPRDLTFHRHSPLLAMRGIQELSMLSGLGREYHVSERLRT